MRPFRLHPLIGTSAMHRWFTLLLCASLMGCPTSLKSRMEDDLKTVDYQDGVNAREANIIAHHYRRNNMKWYALEDPVDDGDYWAFGLINGRTYEPIDEPPLLVYKRAWSYKSAVLEGGKPNKPPEPPGR
jgi:hypothetical protein